MAKVPPSVIAWKKSIAHELIENGHDTAGTNIGKCSQTELLLCCEACGHTKYVTYRCQARLCPICSWTLSRERAQFSEALLAQMKYPKFLTLTMRTWEGSPRDGIKYLRDCFNKLKAQKVWKCVKGGCYQIELKPKDNGWHIHIHVLFDAPYIPKQKLFSAWREILQQKYVAIDIRACRTKAQRSYVVKYVSKNENFHNDPALAVEWYEATKGSRLFGTFGSWYNAKLEELLNPEEFTVWRPACENCGDENHMFFARDGPFIFGDLWEDRRNYLIGTQPVERPIVAEGLTGVFDTLDLFE